MWHCDACGWSGETPAEARTPTFLTAPNAWWSLKICPECGEEVYETQVVKVAICSCGYRRGHQGPCQPMCC
jgi:hypothetical protein